MINLHLRKNEYGKAKLIDMVAYVVLIPFQFQNIKALVGRVGYFQLTDNCS